MKRILRKLAVHVLGAASRPPKPMPRIRWY
jgi:hypothetical protein